MMETRFFVPFIIPPMDLLVRQKVGCQWTIQSRPKWRDVERGLDQENAEKCLRGRTGSPNLVARCPCGRGSQSPNDCGDRHQNCVVSVTPRCSRRGCWNSVGR